MGKKYFIWVAVLVSFLVSGLGYGSQPTPSDRQTDISYDRIIASGKIRAAYINYPPGCIVSPKTGEISGIFVDVLKEIASKAGIKVEFVEEVGYATMIQGLDSGRYDMIASPIWANTIRAKLATVSVPLYFNGFGIWVRANETRFSAADRWSSINSPNVKIAALDGSLTLSVAKAKFPKAQIISHPDMASPAELFLDVVGGKADVFLAEPEKGSDYLKTNPGTIKNIAANPPLKVFPTVFLMPKKEPQLKGMIDAGIMELQIAGYVDDILRKYDRGPDVFYPVARPYQVPIK